MKGSLVINKPSVPNTFQFSEGNLRKLENMMSIKKVERDHYLYLEGDSCDQLYYVIDGVVDVCKNMDGGKIIDSLFSSW
ncbi:cyclic nucleotide-binding domain-containing protein [Bacillus taeanensis]|uniref:cyclic nucleotide-binding domain-containing protein n=1 Tax=Bacillus taeanensis TaxID=273032 RepID=UPI0011587F67|nr:cyclic nucleotide-binding domain-containing protein [Bacillus taeanensis]